MGGETSCSCSAITSAFLAEFFGILGGLLVYFLEKTNIYARAHACNAMIWGIIYIILLVLLAVFGCVSSSVEGAGNVICSLISAIVGLCFFVLWVCNWVFALVKGKDEEFKAIPWVEKFALKWAEK